jgi:hypothetical protein
MIRYPVERAVAFAPFITFPPFYIANMSQFRLGVKFVAGRDTTA